MFFADLAPGVHRLAENQGRLTYEKINYIWRADYNFGFYQLVRRRLCPDNRRTA
jgi:hypothetical protein